MDAATNSGKADIKRILEELDYSALSGRRKLYLFDESHQLSTSALDALLKPMEDNRKGSEEKKRLVCIFCTTEPEKIELLYFLDAPPLLSSRKWALRK